MACFPKHDSMHLSTNADMGNLLQASPGEISEAPVQSSYDFPDILLIPLQESKTSGRKRDLKEGIFFSIEFQIMKKRTTSYMGF